MLTAIDKDGIPFHLLPRLTKVDLRRVQEKGEFYCPECKELVMMKIGSHRMEHFAHQKGSICVDSYERESDYHLAGKLQLFHWLETQKLNPELEPFYELIRQRPDIGVSYGEKNIVLEFQCSTIPTEFFMKRTKCYQTKSYTPIWIMGGKNIKRKGERKVSLSNFDYLFLRKSPSGSWYLPAYCPSAKIFILLTNLAPITSKNAFAHISIFPVQQFTIHELLEPPVSVTFNGDNWKREIRIQKSNFHLQSFHKSEFLRELYSHSLNISLLPPVIGLPVQNALVIESAPLIWQAYLFIDHFYNRKVGEIITFGEIYRSFMNRVYKRQIKLRTLPLAPNCNQTAPLAEYLRLLVQLHVLEALNTNTFRINKEMAIPEHFVLQQELEDQFYKECATNFFN